MVTKKRVSELRERLLVIRKELNRMVYISGARPLIMGARRRRGVLLEEQADINRILKAEDGKNILKREKVKKDE